MHSFIEKVLSVGIFLLGLAGGLTSKIRKATNKSTSHQSPITSGLFSVLCENKEEGSRGKRPHPNRFSSIMVITSHANNRVTIFNNK